MSDQDLKKHTNPDFTESSQTLTEEITISNENGKQNSSLF